MADNLTIKIIGPKKSISKFLEVMDQTFSLVVKRNIKPNDRTNDYHCFVDLNPFFAIEKEASV